MLNTQRELMEHLRLELAVLETEVEQMIAARDFKYTYFYQQEIFRLRRKLARLEQLCRQEFQIDGQEIDLMLFDLLKGTISQFRLVSEPKGDLYVDFFRETSNAILCKLPTFSELRSAYSFVYTEKDRKRLEVLGFSLTSHPEQFEARFGLYKNGSCEHIKSVLSVLIWDIFQIGVGTPFHLERIDL